MLKRLTPVVGAMLLTLATFAVAQELRGDHPSTYTVQKGDTLSKISKQFYGDANKYKKIFDANKDQLKDPDKIQPGQVLRIPS